VKGCPVRDLYDREIRIMGMGVGWGSQCEYCPRDIFEPGFFLVPLVTRERSMEDCRLSVYDGA
jgi:hypothetical protein